MVSLKIERMIDMFKKILLATDGSLHSVRASKKVLALTSPNVEATIEVVYVIDGDASKSDVLRTGNPDLIALSRREKLQPIEQLFKEANVPYEIKMLRGEPGPTIVEYANKNDFDIVVIGSRGLNSLQEMVLGSVSHKVAKRVQCPVLLVK
jgi:nucleotide-binding universal stress UspA family protein